MDPLDIPPDLLRIDPARMRELGYWVVDRVIEHLETLEVQPALVTGDEHALRTAVDAGLPRAGHDIASDLRTLADVVLAHQQHGDHPRYFARVPGPSSYPAVLAEWLGTGMQSIASSWVGGSGPTTVELTVLDWLRDAVGLSPTAEGVLVSGGSMANATAFVAARQAKGDGVFYICDQTHSSIARGLRSMGVPSEHIRTITSTADFAMDIDALRSAIAADRAAGRTPTVVVGTAGTTNTGTVDDLAALADLCAQEQLWLHVDGAYGGAAAMSPRHAHAFTGLDRVDSFSMDPHKWLFQPYDVACVWVREPGALEAAFAMYPEYLADLRHGNVDLHNRGLELSRRSRALKLWLAMRAYGMDTLALAIDRGIALAEYAQRRIEADPTLELVCPARFGVVNFAGINKGNAAHSAAAAAITASGYAAVSSTVLKGRTVLRLCIINPRTTTADIDGTIERLSAALRAQ
jgi:aromatic-L-amino-acid decarboxylase